jgi:hypothetical protein
VRAHGDTQNDLVTHDHPTHDLPFLGRVGCEAKQRREEPEKCEHDHARETISAKALAARLE